jgi:hypothetical protein
MADELETVAEQKEAILLSVEKFVNSKPCAKKYLAYKTFFVTVSRMFNDTNFFTILDNYYEALQTLSKFKLN